MKITNVIIIPIDEFVSGSYQAIVETSRGNRYFAIYSHEITEEEVKEDFLEVKSSFIHIN